jgi:hypothetical protein
MLSMPVMPRALFGDLLWGENAVRFVFLDEAGTSENEPVTVVVGIIVHADKQLMMAEAAVAEAIGAVPKEFRENFVFHATDVWGSDRYRELWTMADRLALMRSMMSLPRRLGLPIAMAMVRRSSEVTVDVESKNMTKAQFQHVMAFAGCIASADRYIRTYADLTEVATVVAEDVPEMRRFLAKAPSIHRDHPTFLGSNLIPTEKEKQQGYMDQVSEFRVTRIRRAVHFVSKKDDAILQLADACAFAFRRFLAEQSFGVDFIQAVLGKPPNIEDYRGPSAFDNFYGHPRQV